MAPRPRLGAGTRLDQIDLYDRPREGLVGRDPQETLLKLGTFDERDSETSRRISGLDTRPIATQVYAPGWPT